VIDIAKTLAESGKEVVSALDKRIADVTGVINVRGQKLAENLGEKIDEIDKALGARAMQVADNLDSHIGRFEELLIGRTEAVTKEIETRSRTAADLLNSRMEHLSNTIRHNSGEAAQSIQQLATASVEVIGARLEQMNQAIKNSTGETERSITHLAASTSNVIISRLDQLGQAIKTNTSEAEHMLTQLATTTTAAIRSSAHDAERSLTGISTGVSNVLKQNATEVERTLLGVSAEVARNFVGKADEITAAVSARSAEMTRIVDEKSSGLLTALSAKSQEFSSEVSRVTDHAVKAIEAKGFNFTQTMMDNSEQIARLINEASESATGAVNRSIQELRSTHVTASETTGAAVQQSIRELRETAEMATQSAAKTIGRTLRELQETTQATVEQSKHTATSTVSEILETQNMLRADTTALFERLREANILLQEVLSGAQENMSSIESTLVTRVSDFVTTMHDVAEKTGGLNSQMEKNIAGFQTITTQTLGDLQLLATQFDTHGRSLAEAVELIDRSNRRTEGSLGERRSSLESLIEILDSKGSDLEQRLTRFASLLDQSLEGASDRARDVARLIAESTTGGARSIAENFDTIRTSLEEERKRTAETMHSVYDQASSEAHAMLAEATERFSEMIEGLRRMASEMQNELEATRGELRKGILELPQETADSAAQMRRVIVDQIEALAELNRIVARHGRGLDVIEGGTRRPEAVAANGGQRPPEPARAPRGDISGVNAPPPARRAEAPSLTPGQGAARTGWLSDLLVRASREEGEAPREAAPAVARAPAAEAARHSIDSLDSLAVDIARLIDHDAAAELWDRYKRGERNVFTRRLYTMQGQRAFDEIRAKYRGDREFMRTVDRYITEFERLLEEVSRDDRGQVVARTYLTSETGKVYTMLAHAAGRFD
jgi:hypothetical protein